MSDTGISKHDQVLVGLVLSLQGATMQHLGKIQNPLTGEVERDLDQARGSIDILEMLKAKCRTDTPKEILRLLDTTVMELQMNFLDETKKDAAVAEQAPATDEAQKTDESPDAPESPEAAGENGAT